jgi:hypothetical protein
MVVEAMVALVMAILAVTVMIMAAAASSTVLTAATNTAMSIAPWAPTDSNLLDALAFCPLPVMVMVIMQTGSQVAIMNLMLDVNMMLIMATL